MLNTVKLTRQNSFSSNLVVGLNYAIKYYSTGKISDHASHHSLRVPYKNSKIPTPNRQCRSGHQK